MAEGDGLHVEEADVHLGLDVDPLPDLERREWHQGASPPVPDTSLVLGSPTRLPLPPTESFAHEKQDGFRGYELSKEQLPSLSSGYSGSDLQVLAEMVTMAS